MKHSIRRESDEYIMLQEVLQKLNRIETKKQNKETVAAISRSYQGINMANQVDVMKAIIVVLMKK